MRITNITVGLVFFFLGPLSRADDLDKALKIQHEVAKIWGIANGVLEISGTRVTTEPDPNKSGERRLNQKADFQTSTSIQTKDIKVHYRPLITRWNAGATDYYQEFLSSGFDGKRKYQITEKSGGFPDKWHPDEEIILLKENKELFTTQKYCNGLGAFIACRKVLGQFSFLDAEEFRNFSANAINKITVSEDDSQVTLEFLSGDPEVFFSKETIILNRSRGYALERLKFFWAVKPEDTNPRINTIECHDFQKIEGSKTFFPKSSRLKISGESLNFDTKLKIESAALRSEINGEFEIAYPEGWTVKDKITGRNYKVGERK